MKLVLAAVATVCSLTACMPNFSSGYRVGEIQKVSEKGIIFKSFEGELALTGIKLAINSGNVWSFSATDPAVMKQLEQYSGNGQIVKLHYKQWLIAPWTQDTEYTITKVEANAEEKKH